MKTRFLCLLAIISFFCLNAFSGPKGYLFIIGGGDRPEAMMKEFVSLASRFGKGKIIIFPMASATPAEAGREQAAEFKKIGAKGVEVHVLTRAQAAQVENARILDGAGGVFFSGGVQSRLTDILLDTPIHKKLLEIYERGAVIGGASAGAAVMSSVMITGDERRKVKEGREFETIEAQNVVTSPGLSFIKEAIIDQHFVTRKRHNRLISLVAEHRKLLGIGIDESTAILVKPGGIFAVFGENCVVVYDPSKSGITITPQQRIGFSNMKMHVLLAGQEFSLKSRKVKK